MDSVPVVALMCIRSESSWKVISFQEVDISGVTIPPTKHNFIRRMGRTGTYSGRAFKIAKTGRSPGPF